jgi:hypothetical protein
MRSESSFKPKNNKISRVLKALFDPVHRLKWESDNLASYVVHKTDHANVFLPYWRYNKQTPYNSKEFKDKMCIFVHNSAIYIYTNCNSTSEQDAQSESIASKTCPDTKVDNCKTIVGLYKFWKDESTKKIEMRCFM